MPSATCLVSGKQAVKDNGGIQVSVVLHMAQTADLFKDAHSLETRKYRACRLLARTRRG